MTQSMKEPGGSMKEMDDTRKYYAARAKEYDLTAGYGDPMAERLRERMKARFRRAFRGRRVLEIACGTGYWTRVLASTARMVLATDINEGMLRLARKRVSGLDNVRICKANAYTLRGVRGKFDAAFSHWWWSHVPKARLRPFLENLHQRLEPGAYVIFTDHMYKEWQRRWRNADGDFIEERELGKGRKYHIIKNFPSEAEVREVTKGIARNVRFEEHTEGYWALRYFTI
jgi:demethylmenaquinone methyltransferase/2-methoxy-6-polyprenyl-1,4-benzoquinol methylase